MSCCWFYFYFWFRLFPEMLVLIVLFSSLFYIYIGILGPDGEGSTDRQLNDELAIARHCNFGDG
jgi:hypothetical protein